MDGNTKKVLLANLESKRKQLQKKVQQENQIQTEKEVLRLQIRNLEKALKENV